VVVSIFKCCSKNVYDDDHQEARSMSYSSSFVSVLNHYFYTSGILLKKRKRKGRDLSIIITRDLFPVHHHVIFIPIPFFSFFLIARL
jgi:hypothetical protein